MQRIHQQREECPEENILREQWPNKLQSSSWCAPGLNSQRRDLLPQHPLIGMHKFATYGPVHSMHRIQVCRLWASAKHAMNSAASLPPVCQCNAYNEFIMDPRHYLCICSDCLPKVATRWSQDSSKMVTVAHDDFKTAPAWPKMAPRWSQDDPKLGQADPRWPKVAPR